MVVGSSIPRERSPVISFSFEVSARLGPRITADWTFRGPRHVSAPPTGSIPGFHLAPLSPARHVAAPYRSLTRVNFPPRFRITSFGAIARASPAKTLSGFSTSSSGIPIWPVESRDVDPSPVSPDYTGFINPVASVREHVGPLTLLACFWRHGCSCRRRQSLPPSNRPQARTSSHSEPLRAIETAYSPFLDIWKHRTTSCRDILKLYGWGRCSTELLRHQVCDPLCSLPFPVIRIRKLACLEERHPSRRDPPTAARRSANSQGRPTALSSTDSWSSFPPCRCTPQPMAAQSRSPLPFSQSVLSHRHRPNPCLSYPFINA